MLSTTGRRVAAVLFTLAAALLLPAGQTRAQGRCGQQSGRSRMGAMLRQSPVPPQLGQLVTLQQLALQQQQLALMLAAQQRPSPGQVPPPAQNALQAAQPPQQQNAPAAQPRPLPAPASGQTVPAPEDPEQAAARQLKIARDLLSDAEKARWDGEDARATRMRRRAGERLRDLVASYPGTAAADQAQGLLAKLGS